MADLVLLPGLRERILARYRAYAIGGRLLDRLKDGDVDAATAVWRATAARADREMAELGIPAEVRAAMVADLCRAVRAEISRQRADKAVPEAKGTPHSAAVLAFPDLGGRRA